MSSKSFQNASKLNGIVSVLEFGAVGDGVTDDTAAIQAAIDSISANGGTVTLSGPHLLSGSITVGPNVVLDGQTKPGEVLPQGTWGPPTNGRFDYKKAGTLLLPTSATINLKNRSSLKGLSVINPATALPSTSNAQALAVVAAFSGTAITVAGSDVSVETCMVVGYNKAFYSNNFERPTFIGNIIDCTNGIEITVCTDKPVVTNNHFYPIYSTGHNTNLTDPQVVRRQGTAIYVHDVADGALIYNNITYGFDVGAHLKNLTLIRYCENIHDNLFANSSTSNSVGLKVEGTMSGCAFDNIHCNSNATNYVFSNSGTNEYIQAGNLSSASAATRDLFFNPASTGQISGLLIGGVAPGGAPINIEFSSGIGVWNIGFIQFSECQTSTNAISYTVSDLQKIFIASIQVVGGGVNAANPTIGGRFRSHKNYILSGDADKASTFFPGSLEGNGQWIIEGKTAWTKRVALGVDTVSGDTMTAFLQAVEAGVAAREMQINPRGGTVQVSTGVWNTGPMRMGTFYLWVDSSGRLRIKSGAPTSDTDGTVVGTQS
jgi:hypothetical protein